MMRHVLAITVLSLCACAAPKKKPAVKYDLTSGTPIPAVDFAITARARAPLVPGVDAWYEVTLRNNTTTERIVDQASLQLTGFLFSVPGGEQTGSGETQSDNFWYDRKCFETGLTVIKPGGELTTLVKVTTPAKFSERMNVTLEIEFWVVTALVPCKGQLLEARSVQARLPQAALAQEKLEKDLSNLEVMAGHYKFEKIVVLRIPDDVMFQVAPSPEYLREHADYAVTFRMGATLPFAPLMSGISTKSAEHGGDLRWGVIFYRSGEEEAGSLFVDGSGTSGYVNGQAVTFHAAQENDSLAQRLRKLLKDIR